MTPAIACISCARLRLTGRASGERTCDAFPTGIPDTILQGDDQHREAVDGDHGLRWWPAPGFEWLDVPDLLEEDTTKVDKAATFLRDLTDQLTKGEGPGLDPPNDPPESDRRGV